MPTAFSSSSHRSLTISKSLFVASGVDHSNLKDSHVAYIACRSRSTVKFQVRTLPPAHSRQNSERSESAHFPHSWNRWPCRNRPRGLFETHCRCQFIET
jgi:hypothetical protein